MRTEYKRDMNHNYLVIHGEEELDTSSYQIRMLVGNVIPSLLKCRIQGMDGNFVIYYDITSRQSLAAFYENKKMKHEDLKLIFGEFIRVMEDAAEYLINPGQLMFSPEYIFLEVEKKEIYFCLMPGQQKEIREQFQALTEYILPKIDHEDPEAVMTGYGVYRRALEDTFHLEHIKEELYRVREKDADGERELPFSNGEAAPGKEPEASGLPGDGGLYGEEDEFFIRKENCRRERQEKKKKNASVLRKLLGFFAAAVIFTGIIAAKLLGYLPGVEMEVLLGGSIVCMAAGMLIVTIVGKHKQKKAEEEYREGGPEMREYSEKMERKTEGRIERKADRKNIGRKEETEISEETGRLRVPLYDDSCISQKQQAENRELYAPEEPKRNCGETVVLSAKGISGPSSLVSREPGALPTIYLEKELTVIGKLDTASDAVLDLPTVSRVHAKIRKREEEYYLTDLNSRNGTSVNGRILRPEEEYRLENEDEVDFAQARYIFLK